MFGAMMLVRSDRDVTTDFSVAVVSHNASHRVAISNASASPRQLGLEDQGARATAAETYSKTENGIRSCMLGMDEKQS